MNNIMHLITNMVDFAAAYGLTKCCKTMIAGVFMLAVICLVRRFTKDRNPDINFYAMLLLLPMALTGMNKVFYYKRFAYLSVFLNSVCTPLVGKIYFGVALVLLVRFIYSTVSLGKRVRKLPQWTNQKCIHAALGCVSADAGEITRHYLRRVKVYVTSKQLSPFSGGIINPYIVIPFDMAKGWNDEKCRIILCHEYVHIRSGHIIWSALFSLLRIYWWANPLVYLCERQFHEDMEMACDGKCVCYAQVSMAAYGNVLLEMIALVRSFKIVGTTFFAGRGDFQVLQARIGNLGNKTVKPVSYKGHALLFTWILVMLLVVLCATSYPKYTKLEELTLYDEELTMLAYDTKDLNEAVQVENGSLVIDDAKFSTLLQEMGVTSEHVYIGFECYMKVPGCGGGGNTGMVSTKDCSDIFYLRAECIENDIAEFLLKYII